MRLIHLYLLVYFGLVAAAGFVLWSGGLFARISPVWTLTAFVVVIGLGALVALTASPRPAIRS